MIHNNLLRRLVVAFVLLGMAAPITWGQSQQGQQDPSSKERKVKPELKKAYKDWLDKDVAYIITDEERRAFKKLQTDEEREQFIEAFWRRRDPEPDTDENEYREQYYERIAYANEHYTSGIPGWKSDRGRIYITFGKPDEVETHPAGGPYERPSYQGGGSTSTYPFEIWFYRYIPGIGSGIEIEFVDPTGSGEYRIARSPDEKDALANVPGAGLTLSEQLGLSSKADRIAGLGGGNQLGYQREQDSPFNRLLQLSQLNSPPAVKYSELDRLSGATVTVEDNPLNFGIRVDYFRQSDERVITTFTIQTENKDLTFKESGGAQVAQLNIFGRIMAVSGRRAGIFEDPVTTTATVTELTEAKERKSVYQKAYALAPGHYKVDVVVRDVNSGATGIQHVGFEVPKYDSEHLSTSTLILASRLQGADQPGMFTIGNLKVIPNVTGTFHHGDAVGIYLQVYNAGIDQTTLRPSVTVEYVLTKDGKEIFKQPEDWSGMSDSGQRLTLARLLDTRNLTPGNYEVSVKIRDQVSSQLLSPSAKFTIIQ